MWQSKEEEEKQRQLERLIDWELNKQLTWVVFSLTFFLGLTQVLPFLKLTATRELTTPIFSLKANVNLPFFIIYLLLIAGLDVSIFRLATTLERIRNWELRIPCDFMQKELRSYPLKQLYDIFLIRICENRMVLRKWLVLLLIFSLDLTVLIGTLLYP